MIRNIVFDFGGIFCNIDLKKCIDAFKALGFDKVEKYMDLYSQKGFFGEMEEGLISDKDFLQRIRQETDRNINMAQCRKAWLAFIVEVITDNLHTVRDLQNEGYNIALLSNTNPFVTRWFRSKEFDGESHGIGYYIAPEHQYLSFEMKLMKPDERIFREMLNSEEFEPDETLFVDDGAVNIKAAERLGIHGFLAGTGEHLGERLMNHLRKYGKSS